MNAPVRFAGHFDPAPDSAVSEVAVAGPAEAAMEVLSREMLPSFDNAVALAEALRRVMMTGARPAPTDLLVAAVTRLGGMVKSGKVVVDARVSALLSPLQLTAFRLKHHDVGLSLGFQELACDIARQIDARGLPPAVARQYLSAIMRDAIDAIAKVDPQEADRRELAAIKQAQWHFQLWRHAPWEKRESPALTKAFADQALQVLTGLPRASFLSRCDLGWIAPDERAAHIRKGSIEFDAMQRFDSATAEETALMVERCMHMLNCPGAYALPGFSKLCARPDLLKPLFEFPTLRSSTFFGPIDTLRHIAARHGERSTAMLNWTMTTLAREFDQAQAGGTANVEVALSFTIAVLDLIDDGRSTFASIDHLRSTLLELGAKGLFAGFDVDTRKLICDEIQRSSRGHHGLPLATAKAALSAFVEAGAIKLSDLKPSALIAPVVGAALTREPQRLAEITDPELFVKIGKRFNIPVELPPEVARELAMKQVVAADAAASTTAGADPLAGVVEQRMPSKARAAARP